MSNGEVKRWWVYEIKPHNDGDQFSHAKVARFENRRERTEKNGMEYFKPKFGEVFEGPATESLVMRVEDHERIVAELRAELDERTEQLETTMERYRAPARTISSQKRVIDRFRQSINDLIIYVDSDADSFGDRYWQTRNTLIAMLEETAAIEKGEA